MKIKAGEYIFTEGDPAMPGATAVNGGLNVAFALPVCGSAEILFRDPESGKMIARIPVDRSILTGRVAAVFAEGPGAERLLYAAEAGGEQIRDPYGRRFDGNFAQAQDPEPFGEDTRPSVPFEEMCIYKLHVRGFTKDSSSGTGKPGTFAGVKEKIPYIRDLGFNAVEFMPMYEWDAELRVPPFVIGSDDGKGRRFVRNYWGYAEKNCYFMPKRDFVSSGDPRREVRDMVRAFHEAGIVCLMEFYVPDHTDARMVQDALRYWADEYHIDGFHLTGAGVPAGLLTEDPILADEKLIFSYVDAWRTYGSGWPETRRLAESGDRFLYAVRSALAGRGDAAVLTDAVRTDPKTHAQIKYAAEHDGLTLADAFSYAEKHNEENGENNADGPEDTLSVNFGVEGRTDDAAVRSNRMRRIRTALAMTFLSPGTPLLMAGDELLNSQEGNSNGYILDSPKGWVSWSEKDPALIALLKKLTAARKETGLFSADVERIFLYPKEGKECAAGFLTIPDAGKQPETVWLTLFNTGKRACAFALPGIVRGFEWEKVILTGGRASGAKDENSFAQGACSAGLYRGTFRR